jgi:hypothetical protein
MNKITFKVIKHEGGWAFEANGTYSQRFWTREAARKAARLAAHESAAGESMPIPHAELERIDDSG